MAYPSQQDSFLLLYKHLEIGRFQWLRSTEEVQALTPQQYPQGAISRCWRSILPCRWLTEGMKTEQPKAKHAQAFLKDFSGWRSVQRRNLP